MLACFVVIRSGKDAGSIASCLGDFSGTEEEDKDRMYLLSTIRKIHPIRAVYIVPVDPMVHQTLFVGKCSEKYAPECIVKHPLRNAREYLLNEPAPDLKEIVQAFLKDSMTKELFIRTNGLELYFTKESVPGEVNR